MNVIRSAAVLNIRGVPVSLTTRNGERIDAELYPVLPCGETQVPHFRWPGMWACAANHDHGGNR